MTGQRRRRSTMPLMYGGGDGGDGHSGTRCAPNGRASSTATAAATVTVAMKRRRSLDMATACLTLMSSVMATAAAAVDGRYSSYYCGTSFEDASSNCRQRMPCLEMSDEGCPVDHACFAVPLCDDSDDSVFVAMTDHDKAGDHDDGQAASVSRVREDASASLEANDNEGGRGDQVFSQGHGNEVEVQPLAAHSSRRTKRTESKGDNEIDEKYLRFYSDASSAWRDNPADARNFQFCGMDWTDAVRNCNIARHCPDLKCPHGLSCFVHLSHHGGADHCNAYEFVRSSMPTRSPTYEPTTPPPTPLPTSHPTSRPNSPAPVDVFHGLCAHSYEHLAETFLVATECSNINPCAFGQLCFPDAVAASLAAGAPKKESQHIQQAQHVGGIPTYMPTTYGPTTAIPTFWGTYSPTRGSSPYVEQIATLSQHVVEVVTPPSKYQSAVATVQGNSRPSLQHGAPTVSSVPAQVSPDRGNGNKNNNQATPAAASSKSGSSSTTGTATASSKKFYCASNLRQLKRTCALGQAQECEHSRTCPQGQGCIEDHGECEQQGPQQKHAAVVMQPQLPQIQPQQQQQPQQQPSQQQPEKPQQSQQQQVAQQNYYPDICPPGFVGLHSPWGDCQQYFNCQNGFLESSHTCNRGKMFDNVQGKCIPQKLVDGNCNGDALDVTQICPRGLIGLHSPGNKLGVDCAQYYKCSDGNLEASRVCEEGTKFDNGRRKCVSWYLVDGNCHGIDGEGVGVYEGADVIEGEIVREELGSEDSKIPSWLRKENGAYGLLKYSRLYLVSVSLLLSLSWMM